MSKQITPEELAAIVTKLLTTDEIETEKQFSKVMTDIARLICKHFGGRVLVPADMWAGKWLVGISKNDSLPPDGGIWKDYDPEGL